MDMSSEYKIPNILNNDSYLGPSSWTEYFKSISISTWLLFILILAVLGFNIFIYLAKGTQYVTNTINPILNKFFSLFFSTTGQIVDVTATGTKQLVNTTANIIDTGLTDIQQHIPQGTQSTTNLNNTQLQNTIPHADLLQNNTLNQALNTSLAAHPNENSYHEDDTTSNIQTGINKSGYCYIGEDRGYRSCAYVGVNDNCLSGEIFPTNEICVNPNLRV